MDMVDLFTSLLLTLQKGQRIVLLSKSKKESLREVFRMNIVEFSMLMVMVVSKLAILNKVFQDSIIANSI